MDKKLIQTTLEIFQPHYDELGITLTESDAIDVIENMTGLFLIVEQIHARNEKNGYKNIEN